MNDCTFCLKFSNAPSLQRQWFDEVLWASKSMVVVAGIGGFRIGYVLLVSREHHHSFAEVVGLERDCFDRVRLDLASRLSDRFGRLLVYESASVNTTRPSGACIDHAHWHFVPTKGAVPEIVRGLPWQTLTGFSDARERIILSERETYCYLEADDTSTLVTPDRPLPSQFVRRRLARLEGVPDEWDWAVYPRFEFARKTIEIVRELISGLGQ